MAHTNRFHPEHPAIASKRQVRVGICNRPTESRRNNSVPGKHLEVEFRLDSNAYDRYRPSTAGKEVRPSKKDAARRWMSWLVRFLHFTVGTYKICIDGLNR